MNKIRNHIYHYYTLLAFMCTNLILQLNAFATETTEAADADKIIKETIEVPISGDGGAADELKNFLIGENGFMSFVSQAGMVLIAFGVGQLILAFKDDNPEAKSRGTMILLGGVFCVTISGILTNLGVDL